jgi:hypothetical protein
MTQRQWTIGPFNFFETVKTMASSMQMKPSKKITNLKRHPGKDVITLTSKRQSSKFASEPLPVIGFFKVKSISRKWFHDIFLLRMSKILVLET